MSEKKKINWLNVLVEVVRIIIAAIAGAGGAAAGII